MKNNNKKELPVIDSVKKGTYIGTFIPIDKNSILLRRINIK